MSGNSSSRLVSKEAVDDYGSGPHAEWRSVNWRDHLEQLDLHGSSVNYVDIGKSADGEASLLMIHGLSGCWQNWLENIPYFARSRRVIAIDLPGFGRSQMPKDLITIPGYGRFVDSFSEKLGLGKIDVVGSSMGGLIASEFASRFTDRVRRLALVSPAGVSVTGVGHLPLMPGRRINRALGALAVRYKDEFMRRKRARWLVLNRVVRYPNRISPELLYEMSSSFASPGFWDALNAVLSHGMSSELENIKAPTLIIWGRSDRIVSPRGANIFDARIPLSQKVIFDNTGHAPMIERPSRFNRLLDEFLSGSISA